jgi:hypothetical protein
MTCSKVGHAGPAKSCRFDQIFDELRIEKGPVRQKRIFERLRVPRL